MRMDQESGSESGRGAATRQITLRMDRALHSRLKHALTERDIKFQPLVTWLIGFWLDNPDFQAAATNLTKTPIGKAGAAVYSGANASAEVYRFAEIFAKIPGGGMVQRKAIEFLEAALALHESVAITRGNEEAALNQITQQALALAKQVESYRSNFAPGGRSGAPGEPGKKRSRAGAGGSTASPSKKEAPW